MPVDNLAYQTLSDGQSLLDEMSRPVKNAMGKDITPDYSAQIKHVQKRLEDLQERKLRCNELSDVRKLKLQQILQLRTCERDAEQVRRLPTGLLNSYDILHIREIIFPISAC